MEEEDIVLEEDAETKGIDTKDIVAKLREKLKIAESEKQEYLNGWQRAKADYINSRKKDEETNRELAKYATEDVLLDIIPVLDSFDMAFGNKEAWEKISLDWRKGVEYIYSQLLSVLGSRGLKQNIPIGEIFDPMKHEAVETIDTENESEDQKIVAVVQKGYSLGDRVIRAAKVKIALYKK